MKPSVFFYFVLTLFFLTQSTAIALGIKNAHNERPKIKGVGVYK